MINVAIDGPAGAGKSTIAKAVSKELGYIYVDTGALYRTIALNVVNKKIDPKNHEDVEKLLNNMEVELKFINGNQCVYLNGGDVSALIRTPEISMVASAVSQIPSVRAYLLELQRGIARKNNCIMDGRDIGTVVLPDAKVKIFLTASPECRAERRFKELIAVDTTVKYADVLEDIINRDYADSNREIAPLKPCDDSIIFDTTELNLDESISKLSQVIKENI